MVTQPGSDYRNALDRLTAESERQKRFYEAILSSTPDLVYVFDLDYRFSYANAALLQMWGRSLEDSIGKSLLELGYAPWHAAMHERELDRVVATKQPIRGEVSFPHATLGLRIYDYIFVPVLGARGEVESIAGTTRDITEQVQARLAIVESESRFRAFVSASSDVIYSMSPDWAEMRSLKGRDFIPDTDDPSTSWLQKYIHPDDQAAVLGRIAEAIRARAAFEFEHRVIRVDGSLGWTFSRAIPILNQAGEITEWFGTAADVTERRHQEEQQKLLLDELNHRVKNTLSTVQSVARQTLRNVPSLDEFRDSFESRLLALSQAHDLLTRGNWRGADVHEVVAQTLSPYPADRTSIVGATLRLRPNAAVMLNLIFHELATNAAKYGAFTTSGGRVTVRTRLDFKSPKGMAEIQWTEEGGPLVATPTHNGFGTRVIERGIRQELEGDVTLDFARSGVQCRIRFPLDGNAVSHD